MYAIILAAGRGTRLGGSVPKPLTPLSDGRSILDCQLDALKRYIDPDRIVLVLGYKKELLMEHASEYLYVYNPDYAQENTAKSLLRALRKVEGDVLWLNGDVVFEPSLLPKLIRCPHSAMMVNQSEVGEEEVKYLTDAHGRILSVSKEVEQAEGEALGINRVADQDRDLLVTCLENCGPNDYFEHGVQQAIRQGAHFQAVDVPKELCIEVDFPEDLALANTLRTNWLMVGRQ
jgi:choline kinase